jgi:hypothetical protein
VATITSPALSVRPVAPAESRAEDRGASHWSRGAWLFPLALWLASTFFYMGQTGRYSSDWSHVVGAAPDGSTPFWRPLNRLVVAPLIAAFGDQDWVLHLLGALAHAGTCLLVWRLLALLRVNRVGAAAAAVCFMVYPACFEAVLWTSALPTLLAAGLVVGAWLLACLYARDDVHPLVGYPVVPAMFFASSCLDQEAAYGVIAIPLLCLAARDVTQPRRAVLERALFTTGLSVAGVGAAVGLHVVLREVLHVAGAPEVFSRAGAWTGEQWIAAGVIPGAFRAGLRAVGEHPFRAAALLAVLVTGFFCWVRSTRRGPVAPPPAGPRAGLLVAAAAVACVAPVGAVMASAPEFSPRFAYAPAMGLALGAACHFAARGLVLARPAVRTAGATVAGGAVILASITMMGFQRGYQERAIQDRRELAELVALLPDPEPGSVFVPVAVEVRAGELRAAPRGDLYERYFRSRSASSVRSAVQWAYGRRDLTCAESPADQISLTRIRTETVDVRGVGEVPWSRIIPFTVDVSGGARLVTSISAGGRTISIPQTRALAAAANDISLPDGTQPQNGRLTAGGDSGGRASSPRVLADRDVPGREGLRGSEGPPVAASQAGGCYANCDGSRSAPVLNINDFVCFLSRFAVGDPYANCDGSTNPPTLNALDFTCFLSRFEAGCS